MRIWRIVCALVVAGSGFIVAGCSQTPSASQDDLYTCSQVAYWNNYVLTGKAPADDDNDAINRILGSVDDDQDLTLTAQGDQAKKDYAANRINATATDLRHMTTTCLQWGDMGPPGHQS